MNAAETFWRELASLRRRAWKLLQSASTSQKLAFAFALFLVPLAFVSGKLAEEQQRSVDMTTLERDGAAYLRVINEARTLLNMQSRAQELNVDSADNISPAIRALNSAERRFGDGLQTAELSERAVTSMRVVIGNERARATAGTIQPA